MQGPLLAAPLAWLPFGGRELFRQVAAALFAAEIARQYLSARKEHSGRPPAFLRARAFNEARKQVLDDPQRWVTVHQAMAFDIYGLG